MVEIAELLGYSVEFIPYNRNQKVYFPTSEEKKNRLEQIATKSEEGMIKIPSFNFGETIIYGADAQAAADQLMKQPTLSKSAEILLHHRLQKELNVLISVTNSHVNS